MDEPTVGNFEKQSLLSVRERERERKERDRETERERAWIQRSVHRHTDR